MSDAKPSDPRQVPPAADGAGASRQPVGNPPGGEMTIAPPSRLRTPLPTPAAPPAPGGSGEMTIAPPSRLRTPLPTPPVSPMAKAPPAWLGGSATPAPAPASSDAATLPASSPLPASDAATLPPPSRMRTPAPPAAPDAATLVAPGRGALPPGVVGANDAATIVDTPGVPHSGATTVPTSVGPRPQLGADTTINPRATSLPPQNLTGDPLVDTLNHGLQLSRRSVFNTITTGGDAVDQQRLVRTLRIEGGSADAGRFSIKRKLAAGGMGAVLEIADRDFGRNTAMKVIKPEARNHPDALVRFLAEARVTAQLEHPNIVPIHDLGAMGDGTLFFTMKFIRGRSFGQVVKALKEGDAAVRAEWNETALLMGFLKVLDGVGFAHAQQVVHRDIKPDNIMIGAHGEVLVVDWGIAKMLDQSAQRQVDAELVKQAKTLVQAADWQEQDDGSLTMDGQAMGTPMYMPPEQARGDLAAIDGRSDIYALGATLYELITLKRSVEANNLQALLNKVMVGDIIPVTTAKPDIDPDLAAIITKAMRREPADRYQTCGAMAADIRSLLAGQAVAARQRSLAEALRAWVAAHRRELILGGVAAAGVVLVAGSVYGYITWQNRIKVDALLAEGQREFEGGKSAHSLDQLRRAEAAAREAKGIDGRDERVLALLAQAQTLIAIEEKAQKERAAVADWLDKARSAFKEGRLEEAKVAFTSALKGLPADSPEQREAMEALQTIAGRLADSQRRKLEAEAAEHLAAAKRALASAKTIDLADKALLDRLDEARKELNLAGKDGLSPADAAAVAADLALLSDKVDLAKKLAADRAQAADLAAQARQALEAGQDDRARTLAEQALGLDPRNTAADATRLAARDRLAKAEEAKAKAAGKSELVAKAQSGMDQARSAYGRLADLGGVLDAARRRVETLSLELERKPADQKAALWDAHARVREAETALATAQSAVETGASSAAAALAEFPDHPLRTEARGLLSRYYQERFEAARIAGDAAGTEAFRRLIAQVDDGTWAASRTQPARLVLVGAGTVELRKVAPGRDTRLVAEGPAESLALPVDRPLPAGRWQLLDQRGVQVALVAEPGQRLDVAWPGTLPALPGTDLRWVPPPPGGKAFLLGRTEVSHGQYLAFVNDPKVLPMVAMQYDTVVADAKKQTELVHLPRDLRTNAASIKWGIDRPALGAPITRFTLKDIPADQPVSGIDRDDAAAYCAWLGGKHRLKVRLPTAAEFQWAATGGDPQRRWPWGPVFDGSFTVAAFASKPDHPLAGGSLVSDQGPFGHYDLAGNLREWISNEGRQGAQIAAGGFGDDNPAVFAGSYVENLEKEVVSPAIGFRVLIEMP
ncbi:MAG: SUMF1/EgtB/PvdO family nonheme iron enzyme [Planctomycetes bacterium]|nr:SUMF1/EgtB/PvdO family nonheme iron enzyme [Planctomycetota bacterium]